MGCADVIEEADDWKENPGPRPPRLRVPYDPARDDERSEGLLTRKTLRKAGLPAASHDAC